MIRVATSKRKARPAWERENRNRKMAEKIFGEVKTDFAENIKVLIFFTFYSALGKRLGICFSKSFQSFRFLPRLRISA